MCWDLEVFWGVIFKILNPKKSFDQPHHFNSWNATGLYLYVSQTALALVHQYLGLGDKGNRNQPRLKDFNLNLVLTHNINFVIIFILYLGTVYTLIVNLKMKLKQEKRHPESLWNMLQRYQDLSTTTTTTTIIIIVIMQSI